MMEDVRYVTPGEAVSSMERAAGRQQRLGLPALGGRIS